MFYSYCLKKCLNLENTLVIFPVIGKGVSKQVKKTVLRVLISYSKFIFGAEAWRKREITSNFSGE